MFRNVGGWDRVARLGVAGVMLGLLVKGIATGLWAGIAAVVAVIMILTAMLGACPIYQRLGISTARLPKRG